MIPGATYRLQLHAGFGFEEAAAIAPYLARLGVTHVYCSPYLQATRGSSHGYDVVDPLRISEDLGGPSGHAAMVGAFQEAGLGHILDIVPNHMAADPANPWWWDVLENGPASRYAGVFDIDWAGSDEHSHLKVLVPILEDHFGRVLESGEIRLRRHGHHFLVTYGDSSLPLSPASMPTLLSTVARQVGDPQLAEIADAYRELDPRPIEETAAAARHEQKEDLARRLQATLAEHPHLGEAIDTELSSVDSDPDRMEAVLAEQSYRLAFWRIASEELDYRRFFNIETLIGVRMEDPKVFALTHRLIGELVREGTVSGLRVDHIDGLGDPSGYLHRLDSTVEPPYLIVEKILEPSETLPATWPVHGTTGYDFLNRVNQVFVAGEAERAFTTLYTSLTGETADYRDVVLESKRLIMRNQLAAEVHRMTGLLAEITSAHRRHRDHTRRALEEAVIELVARFSVYRTYVPPGGVADEVDRRRVDEAVGDVPAEHADPELLRLLAELARGERRETEVERRFTQALQQLTAPVMAKGVEDTAFYRFNRFVSLNEVGGDPGCFGRSVDWWHLATAGTAATRPHTMLTLTTHDTKRSADVRARLNVLSEIPRGWQTAVERWFETNGGHRHDGAPDANTEYLLYQTLVGAWPIGSQRLADYMLKASREARVHTSWLTPEEGFEKSLESFIHACLGDEDFIQDVASFLDDHDLVARGRRNSLAQVALLLTAPGVPDLYQGDELWNSSLVDPDNRRPVDYQTRAAALRDLGAQNIPGLDDTGTLKMATITRLLAYRSMNQGLFSSADYEPLATGGEGRDVLAFRRGDLAVVIAIRSRPAAQATVSLPSGRWRDICTDQVVAGGERKLAELGLTLPFSVLARDHS